MLKLLRIEWNKLLPSRSFRVLIAIYAIVFSMFLLVVNFFFEEIDDLKQLLSMDYVPMVFPDIWIITFWLAQPFTVLPAIIIIALVVNEFNYRTARQHVIDGLTRFELILSKFITTTFIALICSALVFFIATAVGLLNEQGPTPTSFFTSFKYLLAFFFRTLGLLTFAMAIGVWIKRTGLSVLLFIVLHAGFIGTIIKFRVSESLGPYMPVLAMNRLLRVMKVNESTIENFQQLQLTDVLLTGSFGEFMLVIAYTAGFFGLSLLAVYKKDLK